jgi:hypothetical protein
MTAKLVCRRAEPVVQIFAMFALSVAMLTRVSSSAWAQETAGWRQGVVVDDSGGVIQDARVMVRSAAGAILRDATTAADGTFAVGPLPLDRTCST